MGDVADGEGARGRNNGLIRVSGSRGSENTRGSL